MINNKTPKAIIACDFDNKDQLDEFLLQFEGMRLFLKIGTRLVFKEGIGFIQELKAKGHMIFLDFKIHDIPSYTFKVIKSLTAFNPDLISIDANAGDVSIDKAIEAVEGTGTRLVALTVLTSLDDSDMAMNNYDVTASEETFDLIEKISNKHIYAVMCAGEDAHYARKLGVKTIVPGIRMDSQITDDQKRISKPIDAVKHGADYVILGRILIKSRNPLVMYKQIIGRLSTI